MVYYQWEKPLLWCTLVFGHLHTHRIHGAAIYGNMDPINIPPMLAYIPAPWILWDIHPGFPLIRLVD